MERLENRPRLLILTPEKRAYSTTFIEAHFHHLRGTKIHLYGTFFPKFDTHGNTILKQGTLEWAFEFLSQKILGASQKGRYERALVRFIRKSRIDCVLAEFGPVGAEVTDACKRAQCPLIVHFHGFDAYASNILNKYSQAYHSMFNYARFIVVVSKHMEKMLLALGAPAEKVIYNCYGPMNERFQRGNQNGLNFVSVGRFVDKKAPYLTILAFTKVLKVYPSARLDMIGDGPLLHVCKMLVRALDVVGNVNFHGVLPQHEIFKYYEKAYCYVQHSIVAENGDSEGTPLSILEAARAGLPIVATRHRGIMDVVVDGTTGFLVDEGNVNEMAEKMLELAGDSQLAVKMGTEGQNLVSERFTLEQHISNLDKLIDSAIHDRNS